MHSLAFRGMRGKKGGTGKHKESRKKPSERGTRKKKWEGEWM